MNLCLVRQVRRVRKNFALMRRVLVKNIYALSNQFICPNGKILFKGFKCFYGDRVGIGDFKGFDISEQHVHRSIFHHRVDPVHGPFCGVDFCDIFPIDHIPGNHSIRIGDGVYGGGQGHIAKTELCRVRQRGWVAQYFFYSLGVFMETMDGTANDFVQGNPE